MTSRDRVGEQDLLTIKDVSVNFGAVKALDAVSCGLPRNKRIGIIGANGAGKTTLLNVISGFVDASEGEIKLDGLDILATEVAGRVELGIVRGFQTVRLLERETVETNVLLGRERFAEATALGQIFGSRRARREEQRNREVAQRIMQSLGIWTDRKRPVSSLPFASRRLVEVARTMVAEPKLLLLDEPMAGLDAGSRAELAATLVGSHEAHNVTMVMIEHDVDIVKSVCEFVVVLEAGSVLAVGEPEDVFARPEVRKAYLGASDVAS